MQPTEALGELPDGLIQDPQIAQVVEGLGECNAASAVDKKSTKVFNLYAEVEWCVSCWAPANNWDSTTSTELYKNTVDAINAENAAKELAKNPTTSTSEPTTTGDPSSAATIGASIVLLATAAAIAM